MVSLKMNAIKYILIIFVFVSFSNTIFAYESDKIEQSLTTGSAYYFSDHNGYELSGSFAPIDYSLIKSNGDTLRDLGSTWGSVELKETYKISLTKPMLVGSEPLTKDNNIKYSGRIELSPVSLEVGGSVTLTPIAFLEFTLGSTVATGWHALVFLGLGLNNVENELPPSDSFQGVLSQSWVTGTFQFDTAALLSGDTTWKHIVLLTSHTIKYRNFSAANKNDPWFFQGSAGDDFNGFRYHHTTLLGYQMPLILNTAGILVETQQNIGSVATMSTMENGGWGSDFTKIRLGGLFYLKFNEQHSLTIIPQIATRVRYSDDSVKELYFANRKTDTDSPIYYDFDRIAIVYTYNF